MKPKWTNSQRRVRTADELRGAALHVNYELEMLIYSAEHLGGWHTSPISTPAGNDKNMALESFLLHFRNLRAFLFPGLQKPQPDDILASDFLGEPEPKDMGSEATKLAADKERLDRMLAHLTFHRDRYIAAGRDGWPVARITSDALAELGTFLAILEPEMASWFPSCSQLAQERSRLASFVCAVPEPEI